MTLTNGSLITNNKTITLNNAAFIDNGSAARSLTLGTSVITVNAWTLNNTAQGPLTLSAASSTIIVIDTGQFYGSTNAQTYGTVNLVGSSHVITGTSLTIGTLTRTPTTPTKTDILSFASNVTVSGTFTVSNGATVTNRVLVQSNTIGTPRIITAAAISISNADFQDITGAGAATWDMSAASGGSGNCGGNAMKSLGDNAFTAATNTTYTSTISDNWSTVARWSVRVPLPQDTALFGACGTSRTLTQDMPRLGSVDFTSATWTTTFTFTDNIAYSVFGSFIFISGITFTPANVTTFRGRGSYTLDSGTLTWAKSIGLNAPGGTLTLLRDFGMGSTTSTGGISITIGTLSFVNGGNNYAFTGWGILSNGGTLTLGSAIHTITGPSGTIFSGAGTITASTGTLKFTGTLTGGITFDGHGKTYNNVWFSNGTNTNTITITGTNTFADFKDDGTGAHTIIFPDATTTVTSFTVSGLDGTHLITLAPTTTAFTLSDTTGTNSCSYVSISNSTAQGGAVWDAFLTNGCVNGGGNHGWIFSAATSGGNFLVFM